MDALGMANAQLTATFLWGGGVAGELVVDGVTVATVQLSPQEEAAALIAPWVGGGMVMGQLRKKAFETMKKTDKA
jgi:hypothetical protein